VIESVVASGVICTIDGWVQVIDGDVDEGAILSEVWWVGTLLRPQ
jgi:hypothetical protein